MRSLTIAAVALALSAFEANAQVPAAVEACAACHGANGISVADGVPNLAGQKAAYIAAQLKAFRSGSRANDIMKALASQLDDAAIDALAAHFAAMPVTDGSAKSELLASLVRADFPFPADYKTTFTKYHTINFPAPRNQVRHYWANEAALAAAREGKPLPDGAYILVEIFPAKLDADGKPVAAADGSWEVGDLSGFTAMSRQSGWGESVPEIMRNQDWNYAAFKADQTVNTGANQATCLGCHVPHADTSYLFTLDQLKAVQ